MTSRRKGRKGNRTKSKTEDADKAIKHNPYTFFSSDQISQIKSVLKIKEVLNIPIVIGCVILNRIEILDKAVKTGLDINELGPNNTTALIWAVRYKYLDLITFLLNNGGDPTIKIDNGENIVVIALEHKLWDEDSFIHFWELLTKVSPIDVNASNKNGHTLLHIAVRREWEKFIERLLAEKVNIDITNINGVTPLMTACFRNNLDIVNILINNGADFTKEDNHFRTALCYSIITGAKISKPPFLIAERIIFELKKDLSFKEYIKRRIAIIDLILNKDKISEPESEMLVTLTHYIVQYTENGLKIILEFKIFDLLQKIQDEDKRKLLLQLTQELLCYNEKVIGFSSEVQTKLATQFLSSNIIMTCLDIIKKRDAHFNWAFYIVIIFCTLNETGQKWMKNFYGQFKQAFKCLPADYISNIQKDFPEEKIQNLMKKKLKKLRRSINVIDSNNKDISKVLSETKALSEKKSEPLFNIKKSKRRTKVMKAKLTKIKNMELTERLSLKDNPDFETKPFALQESQEFTPESNYLTSKMKLFSNKNEDLNETVFKEESASVFSEVDAKLCDPQVESEQLFFSEIDNALSVFDSQLAGEIHENEQMINTFMTDDLYCPYYSSNETDTQNPVTSSLKQFLQTQQDISEKEEPCFVPTFPEWKSKIYQLPFNDWSLFGEKMKIDKGKLKAAIQYMKKISTNYDNTANAITLDAALNIVVDYLKEILDVIITRSKTGWDLKQDVKPNKNGKKSIYLEKQAISELQANFHHLISSICSLAHSNLPEALKNIYQLESTLLHFPVKGKTLLSDVCALENVKIQYTTFSCEAESSFLSYLVNVLNGFEDLREDIKILVVDELLTFSENEPPGLYAKEMNMLRPTKSKGKRKDLDIKIKTMEGAYHLMDSIENLIKDDDELPKNDSPIGNNNEGGAKYSEMVLKILTKHVGSESSKDNEQSRWSEKIHHLQAMKHSLLLLGGEVRLCRYPERSHVISQGGNFNLVTLGLNINNQPLAVKKIPSEHCVCKTLKSLINPLLGLRNKHILHYFICDYEESDLILATPLCEYNIGQYVLLLKENIEKNIFNLNQMEIVRQFLNGLAFLHQRVEPIVHGNLKPSNIFIDIHGVVRLAEFGISKALFKLIEAPKSSLIWFSQESYRIYKITSTMECSISSDIQVAGMLIYFIGSGGVHPFGSDVITILKNLEKSIFTLPPTRDAKNQIFADLVSWMLMYEPNDRPHIKQILSHVLFWTNDRRWRFILNCSGISTTGVPLSINTNDLHDSIHETSVKEQIKGHWVSIARRKFPKIKFEGDDSVAGLLKFIKHFYEAQILVNEDSVNELRTCVLTYFPAFPLTLYRILETTGIIKEYPFIAYTVTENIVS